MSYMTRLSRPQRSVRQKLYDVRGRLRATEKRLAYLKSLEAELVRQVEAANSRASTEKNMWVSSV